VYDFHDGRLWKSESGSTANEVPITAASVTIESVTFYVFGSSRSDSVQPKVVIVLKGYAGASKATIRTTFHIQSTSVQRILDI
jgi:hypothetical protein